MANEIIIGDDFKCNDKSANSSNRCLYKDITFVEGVSYKALYIFKYVSLPTSKIALLSMDGGIKIRNIAVKNTGEISP